VLTDDDVQALADEAERDYEVAHKMHKRVVQVSSLRPAADGLLDDLVIGQHVTVERVRHRRPELGKQRFCGHLHEITSNAIVLDECGGAYGYVYVGADTEAAITSTPACGDHFATPSNRLGGPPMNSHTQEGAEMNETDACDELHDPKPPGLWWEIRMAVSGNGSTAGDMVMVGVVLLVLGGLLTSLSPGWLVLAGLGGMVLQAGLIGIAVRH
jgi:hypothetical protein